MTVAREDLAIEAAFWAQLPGNFPMRPRKARSPRETFAQWLDFTTILQGAQPETIG